MAGGKKKRGRQKGETLNAALTVEEYEKHVWNILDCYFEENGLQSAFVASYNRFMYESIPHIVGTCGIVSVEDTHNNLYKTVHTIQLTNSYFEKRVVQHTPEGKIFPLYPYEARMRNLNYSSPLSVDVVHTIKSVDVGGYEEVVTEDTISKIQIADIPIMVKSDFCNLHGLSEKELAAHLEDPNDPGGYFIVNGKEKVIVTQEKPANNKLFLFKPMCDSSYQFECEIRSTPDSSTNKVSALWIHIPGNPKSYQSFKDAGGSRTKRKIKSLHSEATRKNALKQYTKKHPGLIVTIATVRGTVPLIILFKALGFVTDREIWETFEVDFQDRDFDEALRSTMENKEAAEIKDQEDALFYLGSKSIKETGLRVEVIEKGANLIREEVLPLLGPDEDRIKGYHLGYMVNRLIFAYLGRIPCDDRDHLKNKRFDLAGSMLATLFKSQIKNLMNECRLAITRRLNQGLKYDVEKNIIRQKLVTRGMLYALSSGNWGDKRRGSYCRVGVAQVLNRLTGMASLSYLRRINSPVNRLVRMTAPRQVHTTGFGYICPADTPEGETVGLLKSLSVMAEVSTDCEKEPIETCLETAGYDSIENLHLHPEKLNTDTKIIINSEIVGTCSRERVPIILEALKQCRREYDKHKESMKEDVYVYNGTTPYRGFSNQVSITHDCECKEIIIRTDGGRGFRPLIVVKNNKLLLTRSHIMRLLNPEDTFGWKNLVQEGIVEYLDAAESEYAMIAMFPRDLKNQSHRTFMTKGADKPTSYNVTYTHCEIHPSMILGVCASLIPFPDHNQSPRNSYQSGMAKQALGVYMTNFYYRADSEAHVMHYPQRPLVTTRLSQFIKYDDNPAGVNTIAAICCYSGYNQEDSVILNKSAVQRGLFRSTCFRTKSEEARVNIGRGDMDEVFEIPRKAEVKVFRTGNYSNLDRDGFPQPGSEIEDGNPLIGKTKCLTINDPRRSKRKMGLRGRPKSDISQLFQATAASLKSYIDSVVLTESDDGYKMVRVRVRTRRDPQIGDKFASRHGQKGVVGMDFSETDLPFTKDGIVPDLILNPHAIPSRMTIGHLLETADAKRCAVQGFISDGTCFTPRLTVHEMGKELQACGFHPHGMEVMYDGATGRKIMSQIFIGPVFYQRLKHMTEDKIHIRARGPLTELCKQPCAGLQRQGGLRFGEMERDSTIAHGAAAFLRERLFMVSDYYSLPICTQCGNFLTRKPRQSVPSNYVLHLKCRTCSQTKAGAVTVEIPYASKLFFQELMSMNIRVTIGADTDRKKVARKARKTTAGVNLVELIQTKMDADMKRDNDLDDEMDFMKF